MAEKLSAHLTIVCENTVGHPLPLLGEHGFACLVDSPAGRLLFDTGRGLALMHNLEVLGIDPSSIDAVVLSHGHNDHTGGLMKLLRQTGPRPVYAHPGIFSERFFVNGEERRSIGMTFGYSELEAAGARFRFVDECTELAQGLWFSGYIPRVSRFETGDQKLVLRKPGVDHYVPDPFDDDGAMAIKTSRGYLLLLGCAHAGLINTVEHFRRQIGNFPLRAIIGGTHLGPVCEEQFLATMSFIDTLNKVSICVGHCTGQERSALICERFPGRTFFASTGSTFAY
jgi:7,8-dihydropterin-6-yl-methyl-4-(beta-D-ribofuranosyl)aminobenzene 5'-phosphate synthase